MPEALGRAGSPRGKRSGGWDLVDGVEGEGLVEAVENEGQPVWAGPCLGSHLSSGCQECVRCEVSQGLESHLPPLLLFSALPTLSSSHLGSNLALGLPDPPPPLLISEPSLLLSLREFCLQKPPQLSSFGLSPPFLCPIPSTHPSLTGPAPSFHFTLLSCKPLELWPSPAPCAPPCWASGFGLGHPFRPLERGI